MTKLFRLTIHILLLLTVLPVSALPFPRVRTFNVRDGLPSNFISRIDQDDQGMIWISTWNGICFYDGYQFSSYRGGKRYGPLTSNRILDIAPAGNSRLWVLTYDNNPYLFDAERGRFVQLSEAISKKTGKIYKARRIVPSGDHAWIIGETDYPALRVSLGAPDNPDSITVFRPSEINRNARQIVNVRVTPDSLQWIYTDKGVRLYGTDRRLDGKFLTVVYLGGRDYFVSSDGKFYSYSPDKKKFERLPAPPIERGSVRSMIAVDKNRLAAATEHGIAFYDVASRKWKVYPKAGQTRIDKINADSKGRIWAFGENGDVFLCDSGNSPLARQIHYAASLSEGTMSNNSIFVEDTFGTIWIAPKNGRFAYYDESSDSLREVRLLSPYLKYTGIPNIDRHFVDKDNNLWLSYGHDLALVNLHSFTIKTTPFMQNEQVRSVLCMRSGGALAGTTPGYLGFFSENGNLEYFLSSGGSGASMHTGHSAAPTKFSDHIYALMEDSAGNIWVGTKGLGIYIIAPDGHTENYRHIPGDPNSLLCDSIYDIHQDSSGNIWIATYGKGIVKAERQADGRMRFLDRNNCFKSYPGDSFGKVRRVTSTRQGVVVLSTTDGIVTFSNREASSGKIRFYTSRHIPEDSLSLQANDVMQTLVTRSGEVYVTTMGGSLQRLEGKDLLRDNLRFNDFDSPGHPLYYLRSSYGEGNILSLVEDGEGNIYIVRETGIVVYSPQKQTLRVIGTNNLGENIEFTEALPSYSRRTGELWFGVVGGLVHFNPRRFVNRDEENPNIVFTGVQYQGDPERTQLLNPKLIEVPAGQRNFSISFAALDYGHNNYIQYAYRLDDDKEWTYIGPNHTVQFSHLSPKMHKLWVKSTDSDGVWVENEASIDIFVHPTFWESIWAKILYVLLTVIVIGGIVSFYLTRRKHAMDREMHLREKKFFIDASHRLRTPLTLIASPVNEVLVNEPLSEKAKGHLQKVGRNAGEMLEMVDRMIRESANGDDYITDDLVPKATDKATVNDDEQEGSGNPGAPDRVKILVVEDNTDMRHFLRDILSDTYNVITASNGKAGLEKALTEQPDFILTDVTMPEMDGLTMVHNIKQNKALSHIPIIVLSAKASLSDRMQGLKEGIDDYIIKPFSPTYLRQRITNIITHRRMLQQMMFDEIAKRTRVGVSATDLTDEAPEAVNEESAHAPVSVAPAGEPDAPAPNAPQQEYKLDSPQIADADQEMMARLLQFIEKRIGDEDLKIEELADSVNMGRTMFYGKIKSLVGMSPSDFLRRLRMQRAEELIEKSKMNFSQIAYSVGFSDPKYFTKCFKKETGMTPSDFRQQARRQSAESGGAPENNEKNSIDDNKSR